MPRKPLIRQSELPYHIYNRVLSKVAYPVSFRKRVWSMYLAELKECEKIYGIKLHCFTLMSNHYHMLVTTPQSNIDKVMLKLQREVSRRLTKHARTQHFRFQSRYKWKLVIDEDQYKATYKYIARNPVEAGICNFVECYPFSTFNKLENLSGLKTVPSDEFVCAKDIHNCYGWLNKSAVTTHML